MRNEVCCAERQQDGGDLGALGHMDGTSLPLSSPPCQAAVQACVVRSSLFKKKLILEKEEGLGVGRKREKHRETDRYRLVVPLFMHSLVDSWMCPDWGLNPQPWRIEEDALTNRATQPGRDY